VPNIAVTPVAPGLTVQDVQSYRDGIGGLWMFGAVLNQGAAPVGDVGLNIGLLNDRGERVARGSVLQLSRNILPPGERGYWVTTLSDRPQSWVTTQFEVGLLPGATTVQQRDYPDLAVEGIRLLRPGEGGNTSQSLSVLCTLRNTGAQSASNYGATAVLFDGGGALVAVNDQPVFDPVPPVAGVPAGSTTALTFRFLDRQPALPTAGLRAEVYARGERR
jgi:hypothetical protein